MKKLKQFFIALLLTTFCSTVYTKTIYEKTIASDTKESTCLTLTKTEINKKKIVSLSLDSIPPPAPTNLNGIYTDNKINLTWKNPTELVLVDNNIASFDNGLDGFTGLGHNTSTGSLILESGYLNNGLKISYDIKMAWDQYAAICTLPALQNFSSTPKLSFWYKGDESVTKLRLIVKQDNDKNGIDDDWWYNETLDLSANEWKLAEIDLSTFEAFTWHTNIESKFSLNNIFSIEFVVPSMVPAKGYVRIDEVKVSGKISPALDFQGVALVRRTDRFPVNKDDGFVVYTGNAETATDQVGVVTDTKYYYSIFAFDNSLNYSPYNVKATWDYPTTTGIFNGVNAENYKLNQNFPNPFNSLTSIQFSIPESERVAVSVFNAIGQKVAVLINEQMSAGQHITTFDGTRFSNGLYNLRLETDHVILTKMMILNR